MASTILYKFRSGTTFEALPLPGSAARLFDVKKAIVTAKKLDTGSMEFDLSVRNANTNEEYVDESMLLPRGTRLIVQRLPAAKGQGFLARMARNQYGMQGGAGGGPKGAQGGAPSGFYTIDSTVRDEDDEEFVTSGGADDDNDEEDKELAALKAVTDTATAATTGGMRSVANNFGRGGGPAGQGPPQRQQHHNQASADQGQQRPGRENHQARQRQNADPELREQEKKAQPKKRATGIPRTFLSLSAPAAETKDGEDGEGGAPLLQPNTLGFEELKSRGGGQSENASGTKKDLDYALKITATTIPEYLQCGICHGVVKNAMFLPWDPEGRTACEHCIRDALTQNGFRCPLTGMEGISPDDLHPNPGIRRATDEFVKGVMEKIEEIEKQGIDEPEQNEATNAKTSDNVLDAGNDEKGIVVSKRNSITNKRKAKDEDDPFGGDDDFGGDVFAVAAEDKPEAVEASGNDVNNASAAEPKAEAPEPAEPKDKSPDSKTERPTGADPSASVVASPKEENNASNGAGNGVGSPSAHKDEPAPANSNHLDSNHVEHHSSSRRKSPSPSPRNDPDHQHKAYRRDGNNRDSRRDNNVRQRRGPPAGYQMGPAGGATGPHQSRGPRNNDRNDDDRSQDGRGFGRGRGDDRSQDGRGFGRGRGGRSYPPGRGGRFNDRGGFRGRGGRGRFGGGGRFPPDQGGRFPPDQGGRFPPDHGGRFQPEPGDFDRDHYGGRGGGYHSRNSRSPSHHSHDDYSNGDDGRASKRPRHDSNDFDGGRDGRDFGHHDSWDDRSAGSGDFHQQHFGPPRGGRGGFRGRGPPRGRGRGGRGDFRGGFDDRFDRGGRGGRFRGGRFRGRGGRY